MATALWSPTKESVTKSNLSKFIDYIDELPVTDYDSLYRWSVAHSSTFWQSVWSFCEIKASQTWQSVLENEDSMLEAKWFRGAKLNFAENLLRYRDDRVALLFRDESGQQQQITYQELYQQTARCAAVLRSLGVVAGDRVAGFLNNHPMAVVAMLATTSIGAIWSSCSPDFGAKGVLERFAQIEPKVLFAIDQYHYNGKLHNVLDTVQSVLTEIPSIRQGLIVSVTGNELNIQQLDNACVYDDLSVSSDAIEFAQLPFDHPLYILYSSGTTGKPKCIVHSAGGTLIQHLKEHQLHTDIKRDDTLFYFTTCGWMMWNWLVSGLASGCTVVLYDGSPFYPDANALWRMIDDFGITVFGTSARFISASNKHHLKPCEQFSLQSLRAILSTGSPLSSESYDYIYQSVKQDVMLSSISGGTDIVSCFVLGTPMRPVYRGEIQTRGLGLAVSVYNDQGQAVFAERGELVCVKPFPCMPLGFWNDVDNRYQQSYFSRFDNVWAHGDYAELTERDGMIIYGRSDAALNPAGVRIGTAEIYRQVDKVDAVLESVCIAQQWADDVRIVLFVTLRSGKALDEALQNEIKQVIRRNTTPRHVPEKIIAVADIPRTLSGKIVELAVRDIVNGAVVKNTDALANPEALEHFKALPELQV